MKEQQPKKRIAEESLQWGDLWHSVIIHCVVATTCIVSCLRLRKTSLYLFNLHFCRLVPKAKTQLCTLCLLPSVYCLSILVSFLCGQSYDTKSPVLGSLHMLLSRIIFTIVYWVTVTTVECLNGMDMRPVVRSSTFGCFPPFCLFPQYQPLKLANWSFVPFVRIPWCASNSIHFSHTSPPILFLFCLSLPLRSLQNSWRLCYLTPLTFTAIVFCQRFSHVAYSSFCLKMLQTLLVGPIKKKKKKKKDHVHERMWSVSLFWACILSFFWTWTSTFACVNESVCRCQPLRSV